MAGLCNWRALPGRLLSPPGGLIDRDLATGEPNGILFEMLGYVREKVLPPLSAAEMEQGMALVNRYYLSCGITSLQEASVTNDLNRWYALRRLKDAGSLKSRVSMMFGMAALSQFREAGLARGAGDSQLRLGGVKIMVGETTGRLEPAQPVLNEQAAVAQRAGFQLAIHAIEPGAVAAAIVALEYARQLPGTGLRHRIEHCSECPPELLERIKRLGTVIVTQPPFVYYSGERYLAMVPAERFPWLYRFRSFFDSGLTVAGSSDCPVVPANPLVGICAAVTRRAETGQAVLPEQSISVRQALAMYTTNAAYTSFEEAIKGSITPGKLADMVVLSDDPATVSPEKIKDITVEMTIIDGEVVNPA
ncbi:amidohydrolase [Chloroflexota bacterium]